MKICVVSQTGYALYNKACKVAHGGAEIQLFFLSKELGKNPDFDVSVITGDYKLKLKKKTEIHDGVKVYVSLSMVHLLPLYINLLYSLIKINPDVVITRAAMIYTGACAFYCKMFKKKFIYSVSHDREVNGTFAKDFAVKLFKYGLKHSSYIVTQSRNQIKLLEEWQRKKFFNITTIKNGFKINPVKIEKKSKILWVARALRWKRAELFLKVAKYFPNEQFIMICTKINDSEYWNNIYTRAKKLNNVTFFNYVPFDEIDDFFNEAKIFVNTSIIEGFPNSFIQAAKNKTPIISLNVNPDNFLNLYECGFYCNDNLNELIQNLKFLLKNQELYNRYARNCFEYAKKNHDITQIVKQWIKLIKALNKK